MKRLWTFLWEEEIPQAMCLVFAAMAFCATMVVLTTPLSLPEPARTMSYALQDPMRNLLFIVGCALVATIVAGILMCAVSTYRRLSPEYH